MSSVRIVDCISGRTYRGYKVPGRSNPPSEEMINFMSVFDNWEGDSEGIVCWSDNGVIEEEERAQQGQDYVFAKNGQLRVVTQKDVREGKFQIKDR